MVLCHQMCLLMKKIADEDDVAGPLHRGLCVLQDRCHSYGIRRLGIDLVDDVACFGLSDTNSLMYSHFVSILISFRVFLMKGFVPLSL